MDFPPVDELPIWRLNLLRAMYLLMAGGLGFVIWPKVLNHSTEWALHFGHTGALLGGIGALSLLGLRYPAQMLPLMLFELLWKVIWLAAREIGLGVILIPLVLPWRYLYVYYLAKPAERWR